MVDFFGAVNPILVRIMQLKIAVVCSSNQNRSMEAHKFLSKRGFNVKSFGSGSQVKLPGSAPDQPNVYSFDTTYDEMYKDLLHKDRQLYTQNGILHMLDRNRRIKARPERFQDCEESFDLVITAEERVYDQVIESLENREVHTYTPVHIINIDIQDNHEEATLGAFIVCHLCEKISKAEDAESAIDDILETFEAKYSDRNILHSVAFY